MVSIISFLLAISHVYRRQKKQFWECPVWWLWRGHLLSDHTRDPGPAIITLPPPQCDNMWQYPGYAAHCSCNVTCSINMFYPVLINTHTRWHRTRVTRIWGMSHTTHILSTTFFGDRGHWQLWPVHQTCIRPQWWQHFLGFWWWRAGLIRESWTKNFLWGDNPGWQARAGNCLPTFLTAASLPSFLRDGDTPLKILMT